MPECPQHPNPLEDVFAEMGRAKAKHGDAYMGSLQRDRFDSNSEFLMFQNLMHAGSHARALNEADGGSCATRLSVLVEEVCELADDVHYARDIDARNELVQVGAMALAWLGVEPPVTSPEAWRRCDGCDGSECPDGCTADQPRDEHSDELEATDA